MSEQAPQDPPRLVSFGALAGWVRIGAGVLAVLALIGVVVDGLMSGLSFGLMVRWLSLLVVGILLLTGVSAAVTAVRGASAAQRRGERLSEHDVGLLPPRRRR
jgi:hypothetical protein